MKWFSPCVVVVSEATGGGFAPFTLSLSAAASDARATCLQGHEQVTVSCLAQGPLFSACPCRQEGSTTTPPVPDVSAATRCSRKERRCTSQVGIPLH